VHECPRRYVRCRFCEQLANGQLIRLLADVTALPEPISILYPQSRHLSPAIRAFIDWCTEIIRNEAYGW